GCTAVPGGRSPGETGRSVIASDGTVRPMAPTPPAPPAVDLRSDTVTRPSAAMREAMATAEVGDDVYAEDPTINALEAEGAALFGHEAALFTPTGSMANQICVQLQVPPAKELLCDADAHVVTYEIGAAA